MKFKNLKQKRVDFESLEPGAVANATLKSFNYKSGYCIGTFTNNGFFVRAIIGKAEEYPIKEMIALKGIEVELEFAGTKVTNGITYPRYYVNF